MTVRIRTTGPVTATLGSGLKAPNTEKETGPACLPTTFGKLSFPDQAVISRGDL